MGAIYSELIRHALGCYFGPNLVVHLLILYLHSHDCSQDVSELLR